MAVWENAGGERERLNAKEHTGGSEIDFLFRSRTHDVWDESDASLARADRGLKEVERFAVDGERLCRRRADASLTPVMSDARSTARDAQVTSEEVSDLDAIRSVRKHLKLRTRDRVNDIDDEVLLRDHDRRVPGSKAFLDRHIHVWKRLAHRAQTGDGLWIRTQVGEHFDEARDKRIGEIASTESILEVVPAPRPAGLENR